MRRTRLMLVAAAVLATLTTIAQAQPGGEGRGPRGGGGGVEEFVTRLLSFDKNKDGQLSKSELPEQMQRGLERFDRNKDGALDKAELQQVAAQFVQGRGRERRGPGGPGGPNQETVKLLEKFDQDKNGWLNNRERIAARKAAKAAQAANPRRGGGPGFGGPGGPGFGGPGGPGFGGPGGRRGGPPAPGGRGGPGRGGPGFGGPGAATPAKPGPAVSKEDVAAYPNDTLYDPNVLRTLFLEFENKDWEVELEDFHGTDVDVPATLVVDGKTYPNAGVHFRGMSSYHHVQRGRKRSFNVSLDLADEQQRLYGYKTLNLLNSHGDPSMMSTVVYSHIARQYLAAPKANLVHVVVNGESWGVYGNVQQFDKTFLTENYGGSKGTRWKVRGNPGADGGLRYLGEDLEGYKSRFDMKSNDGEKAWKALVALCKTLNETPLEELEAKLDPILDIDETLKFLALDVALVNSDGYWTRASDYSLFRDSSGKFHILPHDMNEAFAMSNHGPRPGGRGPGGRPGPGGFGFGPPPGGRDAGGPPPGPGGAPGPGGRGPGRGGPGRGGPGRGGPGRGGPGRGGPGRGGPGHGGVDLDPLVGLDSDRMPLRSRLLALPKLRERYMGYVKQIATDSLDWSKLGPVVEGYRDLIAPVVKADTRKLDSFEAFVAATRSEPNAAGERSDQMSLRKFAVERGKFLRSKP